MTRQEYAMVLIDESSDGGMSRNIYFNEARESHYIAEKGYEEWTAYRTEWEQFCRLEQEADHPPHLEFELNYSCNLKCPMCTWAVEKAADRKADWFKFDDYRKKIDEAIAIGTKSIRLCYINEPLIRKDIDQFVKYAVDAGILDVIITTNGTLLTNEMSTKLIQAGLTKLNVSLDATTEETYNKIRVGGNFNTTISNIEEFLRVREQLNKNLPTIRLTFVTTALNRHERDEFVSHWKNRVDSLGIQNLENPFAEGKFEDLSQAKLITTNNKTERPREFHCPEPFKRLTLRSSGAVLPCCSFYAPELVVGDWKESKLNDIWNNSKMRELRAIHKNGEYFKNPVCKKCIENQDLSS